jgi:Raf kinase inhibitor-like YbhB/YbcL family protein
MKLVSLALGAALLGQAWAASAADFSVSSPTIQPGGRLNDIHVFNGFGCTGPNISPALAWKNAPQGTRSFAVTVYDPDAPTGSGWWHWLAYDIPASVQQLAQGAGTADGSKLPAGSQQGRTDYGSKGFGGACPPVGDKPHRYIITVYALKVDKLEVPADATAALIGFTLNANRLGTATLQGLYGR